MPIVLNEYKKKPSKSHPYKKGKFMVSVNEMPFLMH